MLEIIFGVLCVLVCAFYLYVLLQFRREYLSTKRKPNSLTYLGSSEGPTVLFPAKSEKRGRVEPKSKARKNAAAASRRAAAKSSESALQSATKSNRLPYLEMMLPITAVVTPLAAGHDEFDVHFPARQRA